MFRKLLFGLLLLVGSTLLHAQTPIKKIVFQAFWWDYENSNYPGSWANYLTELAPRLQGYGVDAIWIPPSIKNQDFGGFQGVGYAPYDHYDLGDKFQKSKASTRVGTKDELLRMIAVYHANGIEVIQDIVPNHVIGAESTDPSSTNDSFSNFRYSCWATPATDNSESDYLNRTGRFPKNYQNFHPNPGHNCGSGDICQAFFGPDICYEDAAFGQSSCTDCFNPPQSSRYMRDEFREWLVWSKQQMGFDGVRIDAVKHFPTYAAEDFLYNLQHLAGFASGGDEMFAVGEWVGGAGDLETWVGGVQQRAGTFDFALRDALVGIVNGNGFYNMTQVPGAQQSTRYIDLNGNRIHRTVPFVNNHDTFRPIKDSNGNYTGWNTGQELGQHIEPSNAHLPVLYAIIHAVDGNPQIFFEDLFEMDDDNNGYSHDPTSTTSLPIRDPLANIMWAHQVFDFKSGDYKVRSAEAGAEFFDAFFTNKNQGQEADILVFEREAKAIIGVNDNQSDWKTCVITTGFPPNTVLRDYSGANGNTTFTVPGDQRLAVHVPPASVSDSNLNGYVILAPDGMQNAVYTQTPILTVQQWEMADDLGDSHCQSLGQGGALPANSTNQRTVGKIFVQSGTSILYELTPDNLSPDLTLSFHSLDGTTLHSANGSGTLTGNFNAPYTGWVTAKIRNSVATNPGQNCKVKLSYTAPTSVDIDAFPAENTVAIWTGNAGSNDPSECRNWESGLMPSATVSAIVPAHASPAPAMDGNMVVDDLNVEAGATLNITGTLDVKGHFNNLGTLTGCGTVQFSGNGQQQVSGNATFCNLILDKIGTLVLNDAAVVTQSLDLSNGILSLNGNDLSLQSGATLTGGNSAAYVQTATSPSISAMFRQEIPGGGTGNFPVGTNSYQPVVVQNNSGTAGFAVRVFDGVLTEGTSGSPAFSGQALARSWEITTDGSTPNAAVTLQWNESDEQAGFDRVNGQVYKHDNTPTGTWEPQASTRTTGSDPYSISATAVAGFSSFTVASPVVLPVSGLSFRGTALGSEALLQWSTQLELNNRGFYVERSHNGQQFETIGFVGGAGNSEGKRSYEFIDDRFFQSMYYRLLQIDTDGSSRYSDLIYLRKTNDDSSLTAFPNPTEGHFSIVFPHEGNRSGQLLVVDAAGRSIGTFSGSIEAINGQLQRRLWEPGVYTLRLVFDDRIATARIVVRR